MNGEYIELLKGMISLPSATGQEREVADLISGFLRDRGVEPERIRNNIVCRNRFSDSSKPTLMLNSHIDTVLPVSGYTRNPYSPDIEGDRLYGLGSNDAGASVVSLIATFLNFYNAELPFNLLLAISAEEERSGENGMRALIPVIGEIDMALVGEPTGMDAAVGERGLVVLDCVAKGKSGHAARNEGINALYIALEDIDRLRNLRFPKVSDLLGDISLNVTMINCGTQANVIPDRCSFVVDVRTTDAYTNRETVDIIQSVVKSEVTPRSTRLSASAIDDNHPLVKAAVAVGARKYVSPTMSDMALMPFPSLKIGPGESSRSHSADEFVCLSEIDGAICKYAEIIDNLKEIYG